MGPGQCPHVPLPQSVQWLGLRRPRGRLRLVRLRLHPRLVRPQVRQSPGVHLHARGPRPDLGGGSRVLPNDWVAFIDNAAGQWVLNKGYGRDSSENGLLSAFWSLAAMHSWRPVLYRVTSEANIADLISRADCTLAVRHGWATGGHTPRPGPRNPADDIAYAVHGC